MLNPFINYPTPKKTGEDFKALNKDLIYQNYERANQVSSTPRYLVLWLGSLLIKMGEKLTKENLSAKSTHENA